MLSRLRAVRERHDAGVTLTELLVAMGLTTIIGELTMGLFLTVDKSSARTTDRAINASQARNTLQAWTGYLRVSDGTTPGSTSNRIEWLTPNDLLFYADLYNRSGGVDTTAAATMIWLRLDGNQQLVEEQFPSTAGAGTAWNACRILATRVSATALFTADDARGASLAGTDLGTAPTTSPGCQPLPVTPPSRSAAPNPIAAANLQNVASVAIDFTIAETRGTGSQEYASVAQLPALGGAP
jgi:Tfp pilus assembly protein PilW